MYYDLAIVGNGIIGTLTAVKILQDNPELNICLIGPKRRNGAASVAAGAMLNVFGEIDYSNGAEDEYINRKLLLGLMGIDGWKNFLSKNEIFNDIIVAENTLVYCQENATNLERGCFEAIKKATKKFKIYSNNSKNIKIAQKSMKIGPRCEFLQIENEPAINTNKVFEWMDQFISKSKNLNYLDGYVEKINLSNNLISLKNGYDVKAKKIFICAGAFSSNLLNNFKSISLPILYGVGTALEIDLGNNIISNLIPEKCVIRTPNRGSTCGIHVVPRGQNKFYLGAGSFLSHKVVMGNRFSTIKYLMNSFESDFSDKIQKASINTVLGYRPISFDGKPMIGPLSEYKDIFIATGTKRDGLTYAPVISNSVLDWLLDKNLSHIFEGWEPERKPISYGDVDLSIKAYTDNKLAGLLEHEDIQYSDVERVTEELFEEGYAYHKKIHKKFNLSSDFGVHPEVLNIY